MGALYILGTPLLYSGLLCYHRKALEQLRREEERGHAKHVMRKQLRHSVNLEAHKAEWNAYSGDESARGFREKSRARAKQKALQAERFAHVQEQVQAARERVGNSVSTYVHSMNCNFLRRSMSCRRITRS